MPPRRTSRRARVTAALKVKVGRAQDEADVVGLLKSGRSPDRRRLVEFLRGLGEGTEGFDALAERARREQRDQEEHERQQADDADGQ